MKKKVYVFKESVANIAFLLKHLFKVDPFLSLFSLIVFSFVGILPLIISFFYKAIIDSLSNAGANNNPAYYLIILVVCYIGGAITTKVVEIIKEYVNIKLGLKMAHAFSLLYIDKFHEIDLEKLEDPSLFDTLSRSQSDVNCHPEQLLFHIIELFEDFIGFVSFFIVIIQYSPIFLIFCAISLVLNFVYYKENRQKQYQWKQDVVASKRKANYYDSVQINPAYLPEMHLFDLMPYFESKFRKSQDILTKDELRLDLQSRVVQIINNILLESVTLGIQLYLACLVMLSKLTVGDYTFIIAAVEGLVRSGKYFVYESIDIYTLSMDIVFLKNFLNLKNSIVNSMGKGRIINKNGGNHKIEFKNVSYRYPGTEKNAISNVSFVIEPGETVTLVGENGSGKSTIMKLILRLYDPTDGDIFIDDVNLKEYDVLDYYRIIGAMFQKNMNYSVSVEESVWFGDMTDTLEHSGNRINDALIFSDLYTMVNNLDNQKKTTTSNKFDADGFEPSGGELQKLSLARAFFRKSEIIVLDEPSSALDSISERKIFKRIYQMKNGITTIIITHRLANVHLSSKVLVVDDGKIIECGNHHDLINKKGKYFEMYTKQAQHYL